MYYAYYYILILTGKRRHPGEYEGSDPAVAEGVVLRGKRQHPEEYQDTDPAVTESRAVLQTSRYTKYCQDFFSFYLSV